MGGRILGGLAAAVVFSVSAGAQSKTAAKPAPAHDAAGAAARTRFVVAPTGNEARYRVREQLVGVELPNDAIGTVKEITGSLLVDPNGNVVRDSSKIIVTLTSLKSDKDRRDGYVQRRTIETAKFPTVELVPTSFHGIVSKLSATQTSFDLLADLTVHGTTRPTTWKVMAHVEGNDIVGNGQYRVHVQRFRIGSAERSGRAQRQRHDQAGVRLPLHAGDQAVIARSQLVT